MNNYNTFVVQFFLSLISVFVYFLFFVVGGFFGVFLVVVFMSGLNLFYFAFVSFR